MMFEVEDHPDPRDLEFLETEIRREASIAMGLGDEIELAIFVRDEERIVAGISGWTWGDCCELQSLWVDPSLRGCGLATKLIAAAKRFVVAEEGATMVEYGVMVALIAAVVVGTVVAIGQSTSNSFTKTSTALGGAGL